MAKKLSIVGNYLLLTDTIDNSTIEFPTSRVRYKDYANIIMFDYIDDDSQSIEVDKSDILDSNGDAFASDAALIEWLQINTGSADGASIVSSVNTSDTPLNAGATFTGVGEVNGAADVLIVAKTDQNGTIFCDFSIDGTNWDSTITIPYVTTAINPPHVLVKGARYFRVRFQNTSASNQTYLRLATYYGSFNKLTSTLNSIVPQTFDALVTRPIDFNLMVAKNLYQGHQATLKDGLNVDVDTASVPEDIWQGGGVYTGFPATAEEGQIVVAGSDTGTVFYSYLESSTSTDYVFGSIAVAGAGNYDLGHNVYRCNYAIFVGASDINVSNITIRHKVTTANIFCIILASQGQTFCSAYTVPQGHTAYFDRITGSIRGGNTGASADLFFWWREQNKTPILRIPLVLNFGTLYFDDIDYLIAIPAGTDIIPRVTSVTNNNTNIHISYRIVKVKI